MAGMAKMRANQMVVHVEEVAASSQVVAWVAKVAANLVVVQVGEVAANNNLALELEAELGAAWKEGLGHERLNVMPSVE
jgi:hypothetical protein